MIGPRLLAATLLPAVLLHGATSLAACGQAAAAPGTQPAAAVQPATALQPAPAAQPAPATTAKPAPRPAARKVWTAADLEKLRQQPAPINYLDSTSGVTGDLPAQAQAVADDGPQGVPERLQEMVAGAAAELDRLRREKLAATNPLLRGLAGGSPRDRESIDKDLAKWGDRLRLAQAALENAERAPR